MKTVRLDVERHGLHGPCDLPVDREDGDIKSLVAAETANNSSIFTGILPLLLIGIPTSAKLSASEMMT